MGAISPVPFADASFMKKVEDRVVKPTIKGLQKDGIPYVGFIFIGLMKVGEDPFVIEYNVRMGDPETEVVIPRIKNDLIDLFEATVEGELDRIKLNIDTRSACTIMTVSDGYPGPYEKGKAITGLENVKDSILFHSGTKKGERGIETNGGRVIAVTSFGETMNEALDASYRSIEEVKFEGKYYRTDIGNDLKRSSRDLING
jgi:phosphoribosylamine--glycine ligase